MAQDQPIDSTVAVQGETATDGQMLAQAGIAVEEKAPLQDGGAVQNGAPERSPPAHDEPDQTEHAAPADAEVAADVPVKEQNGMKSADGEPAVQADTLAADLTPTQNGNEVQKLEAEEGTTTMQSEVAGRDGAEVHVQSASLVEAEDSAQGEARASPSEEAVPVASPDAAAGEDVANTSVEAAEASTTGAPAVQSPEATDSIEAAVEAVLPEDAPKGHVSWELTRFCSNHKYPYALFQRGSGADRIRFQVTQMASGSTENAMRIARHCYVMLEKGATSDECKNFRNQVLERVKQVKDKFSSDAAAKAVKDRLRVAPEEAGQTARNGVATNGESAANDKESAPKEATDAPKKEGGSIRLDGDDAPPESAAHLKVRYDNSRGYHFFFIPGLEQQRRVFSVSDKRYGTPFDECQRIGRICYMHFEAGLNKDEVSKVRDDLLLKLHEATAPAKKGTPELTKLKRKSSVDSEVGTTEKPKPKEAKVEPSQGGQAAPKEEQKVSEDTKEKPLASPSSECPLTEDAPPDSKAHQEVKHKKSTGCCYFKFKLPDGGHIHFQATIKAAGSNLETAMRITRLCYVQFEQGAAKSDVEAYRGELYALCQAGSGSTQAPAQAAASGAPAQAAASGAAAGAAPAAAAGATAPAATGAAPAAATGAAPEKTAKSKKRRKNDKEEEEVGNQKKQAKQSDQTSALVEQLRAEGRLAGAMRVEGRAPSAKNASINGLYAVVAAGFGSSRAYLKVGASSPRYLFFSSKKKRWMINDELDDSKKGFAYAKIQDGGKAAPPEHGDQLRWQVFSGKEEGYSEDPAVRCVAVEGAKTDSKDAKEKKAADGKEKATIQRGATVSSINSDSDDDEDSGESDSSSSSSGSDAEEDATGQAAAEAPAVAASMANGASSPAPATFGVLAPTCPPGVRRVSGRVCAKMLVSAGLRCPCHFAYRRDCPNAAR
mmetsp:Transcript_28000/g.80330  ORF Transcript_28000/g.80330 Transcript_28000/m.80330 type:complete len:943 (+) Transcript_28000:112-2940(+)